jgi:hypothetical protein
MSVAVLKKAMRLPSPLIREVPETPRPAVVAEELERLTSLMEPVDRWYRKTLDVVG